MKTLAEAKAALELDESEVREDGSRLPAPHLRPVVNFTPRDRILIRKQGCFNCVHWNNEEMAKTHRTRMRQIDMRVLLERGRTLEEAQRVIDATDKLIPIGAYGVCLGSGGKADFTASAHLCDKWTGRVGVEGTYDPLIDEVYDKKGEKA
jgi:hypothetical protein